MQEYWVIKERMELRFDIIYKEIKSCPKGVALCSLPNFTIYD